MAVGIALRHTSSKKPVWLAGYAARKRAFEKIDSPLRARTEALLVSKVLEMTAAARQP